MDTHCTGRRKDAGLKEILLTTTCGCDACVDREGRTRIRHPYRKTKTVFKCTNVVNLTNSKLPRPTLSLLSKRLSFIISVESNRPKTDLNHDLDTLKENYIDRYTDKIPARVYRILKTTLTSV